MTALGPHSTISALLLAVGCSSSSPAASGSSAAGPNGAGEHAASGSRAALAVPGPAAHGAAKTSQGSQAGGVAAAVPLGVSIIYTAGLTVQAPNVIAVVSHATNIVASAGGYVSAEHTSLSRNRSVRSMVSIQFRIPVGSYQATLAALGGLGTRQTETQRAQDVTQAVADVNSRVASAKAMIVQLRKLLARAGSVSGLLTVQDQISQEEASLEALQSQQRALASETTYATVSMIILGPAPVHQHHHHHHGKAASGFLGGLIAGWHALGRVTVRVLTVAGALLPFVVILGLVAAGAYAAWRRMARRRTRTSPAQ